MADPPKRSDRAASYVRAMITSGRFRPGDSVRPEAVGEALGISATPAREALQTLRVEGFLDWHRNRGFVVAPLTGSDIADVFEVQALVAGELAARAAERATRDEVAELTALHHELIAAATRQEAVALGDKNFEFHREINRIAASPKLSWSLGLLVRYVPDRFYGEIPGWPAATVHDHGRVMDAISSGDAAEARSAMTEHIRNAGKLLAAHFDGLSRAAVRDGGS